MAHKERCRDLVGRVVLLNCILESKHETFAPGETCLIFGTYRGRFSLTRTAHRGGRITQVPRSHFELLDDDYGPFCVGCGCSENDPCEGGCCWAEDPARPMQDVCSKCVGRRLNNG